MEVHGHVGIDLQDAVARALGLGATDIALAVDDLTLQVALVHGVELDDAERADARGGEVEKGGAPEPSRPDAQHPGILQPLLAGHADVGDDEVAAVAPHLVDAEALGRFDEGGQDHGSFLTCVDGR